MSARSPLLLLALVAQRLTVLLLPKPNLAAPGAGSTGPAMLETTLHVCFTDCSDHQGEGVVRSSHRCFMPAAST